MSPFSIASKVFAWIAQVVYWLSDRVPDIPFIGDWIGDRLEEIGDFLVDIALAFITLDEWWDTVWDFLFDIPNKIINIWQYLIDKLEPVWDWFLNAGSWLWGQLTDVFDWVTAFVAQAVRTVRDWFLETLPGYFADFGEWVWDQLDELDAIWESKWSPLKPIIDFWAFFGKKAVDFFNDPIAWFAAVFAAGFELFLQTAGWPFLKVIEAFLVRIWDEED